MALNLFNVILIQAIAIKAVTSQQNPQAPYPRSFRSSSNSASSQPPYTPRQQWPSSPYDYSGSQPRRSYNGPQNLPYLQPSYDCSTQNQYPRFSPNSSVSKTSSSYSSSSTNTNTPNSKARSNYWNPTASSNYPTPSSPNLPTSNSLPCSGSSPSYPSKPSISSPSSSRSSAGLDSSVINNLAIALQLLILSNILNAPPTEKSKELLTAPLLESLLTSLPRTDCKDKNEGFSSSLLSNLYSAQKTSNSQSCPQKTQLMANVISKTTNPSLPNTFTSNGMPNAQFLGTSSLAEPNMINAYTSLPSSSFLGPAPSSSSFSSSYGGSVPMAPMNARASMSLMSPYEALGPNSPFSDPILSSPYGNMITSMRDFQSPYSSIMGDNNKDLFSMDLF